ncbi:MAG: MATE family efflux transporter [Paracoccaceae bacterium]
MSQTLTRPQHAWALLALGLPLVGSHLAQMMLNVTNTILMGWYGVTELAALVLAGSAFFVVFILGSGFAQAIMPMVAQALGRGDQTQVRRDARMGLWLSILFGLLTYPLFYWSSDVFELLGQRPELAALGQDYLRIAGLGMMPALIIMALKSYLSALGRTQVMLWSTVIAVFVNAALAYPLIFGAWGLPGWGVQGAAISTVAVQIFNAAILALYAARKHELRQYHLFQRFWRPDLHALAQVFRLGWPIGMTGLLEAGLFQAATLMMGWIGTVELAAHGIAMQAASLTFMVHLGLASASTVRTGRFAGEGDAHSLREGARVAIMLSLGFALVTVVLFLALPRPILALFTDTSKLEAAAILAFGTQLLAMAALFQLTDAMQAMALGLLRGIRDTQVPMWAAGVSYWLIGIPCSYLLAFPLGYGGLGLWAGLVIGLLAAAGSMMTRFWLRAPRPAGDKPQHAPARA